MCGKYKVSITGLSHSFQSAGGSPLLGAEIVERILGYLQRAGKQFPGIWRAMDRLRARRANLGNWPSWCFLPTPGANEAALPTGQDITGFQAAVLSALFAWRATQGIYRFDQTILDELWLTPISGNIPVQALERLPEWCCYIAFPHPRRIGNVEIAGFFVLLQYDLDDHERDLYFVMETLHATGEHYLTPTVLRLVGTLEECFTASLTRMQRGVEQGGWKAIGFTTLEEGRAYLELIRQRNQDHPHELAPLLSLVLYLASTTREMRSGQLTQPARPKTQPTRRLGPRIFPPSAPRVWDVGFRTGATIRAGRTTIERANVGADGSEGKTHASPRPHLRAAHWHHFWVGPLKGERQLILKWLHPIVVAAGENEEDPGIIPTVHRVASPLSRSAETSTGRQS
jgi:hypothetical protein